MEEALRHALLLSVPELTDRIYPTNAPETATKPYMVYMRVDTDRVKTLDGYTDKQAFRYLFNAMAVRYGDMKALCDKTEAFLLSLAGSRIGRDGNIYVEDVNINNIEEIYEFGLKVNRGIIDFTIYF